MFNTQSNPLMSLAIGNAAAQSAHLGEADLNRVRAAALVLGNPIFAVMLSKSLANRTGGTNVTPMQMPAESAGEALAAADYAGRAAESAKLDADASEAARKAAEAALVQANKAADKATQAFVDAQAAAEKAKGAAADAKAAADKLAGKK